MKPPMGGMFLNGPSYTYMPFMKLASVYSQVGVWFEAVKNGQRAVDLGCTHAKFIEKFEMWKKQSTIDSNKKNIILYDEQGAFTFLKDIQKRLRENYNVAVGSEIDMEYMDWGHIVWFEWADKAIRKASSLPKKPGQIWVVRLHGYELYQPRETLSINWDKVDCLIFVAEHIKKKFEESYSQYLPEGLKMVVIHNGINLDTLSFAKREENNKKSIGVIGILSIKKGIDRLASVICYLDKNFPDYKVLLRLDIPQTGAMQMQSLKWAIRNCKNYEFIPRVENMNSWMEDLKFILSTSNIESFSYVIAEGMAKGIKPLIFNWFGASGLWPKELIWEELLELSDLIQGDYDSEKYRKYIEDNYSLDKQMKETFDLLGELTDAT
jgi:glycosyltransferase involved in cell wall biosynthesis